MECNKDCFNCPYDDCIVDVVDEREFFNDEIDNSQYHKEYYQKNREKILANTKKWQAERPNYQREYYLRTRERQLAQARDRQIMNIEKEMQDADMTDFATFVKYNRRIRSISKLELSQMVGISYGAMKNYEAGVTTPTLEVAGRILAVLGGELQVRRVANVR